jgi:hypothetical protein
MVEALRPEALGLHVEVDAGDLAAGHPILEVAARHARGELDEDAVVFLYLVRDAFPDVPWRDLLPLSVWQTIIECQHAAIMEMLKAWEETNAAIGRANDKADRDKQIVVAQQRRYFAVVLESARAAGHINDATARTMHEKAGLPRVPDAPRAERDPLPAVLRACQPPAPVGARIKRDR